MATTPLSVRGDHNITLKKVPQATVNAILAYAAEDKRSMAAEILFMLEAYVAARRVQEAALRRQQQSQQVGRGQ